MNQLKILYLLLFLTIEIFAQRQAIYTIKGKKDSRLTAKYIASYISTSKSKECSHSNPSTGTRKVDIGTKIYKIMQENYSIDIPVYLAEDEDNCGYRFSRIELVIRRLYDDDFYSLHMILNKKPNAQAIYFGHKGGMSASSSIIMPAKLLTDKQFFRIANDTKFLCKTKWYPNRKRGKSSRYPSLYDVNYSTFYCTMQIKDGKNENKFISVNKNNTYVTHPKFGIDEIKNDTLNVDILVDENESYAYTGKEILNDKFRELKKPSEPIDLWKTIKEMFIKLFFSFPSLLRGNA